MIQRVQHLWLLAAALCAALLFSFGYYKVNNEALTLLNSNYVGVVLTGVSILLSIYTIFMFKKRSLQLSLIWLNLLANIALLVTLFLKMNNTDTMGVGGTASASSGTFMLGAFVPVLTIIFLFAARTGIRKDEKLIKSLDRLR